MIIIFTSQLCFHNGFFPEWLFLKADAAAIEQKKFRLLFKILVPNCLFFWNLQKVFEWIIAIRLLRFCIVIIFFVILKSRSFSTKCANWKLELRHNRYEIRYSRFSFVCITSSSIDASFLYVKNERVLFCSKIKNRQKDRTKQN